MTNVLAVQKKRGTQLDWPYIHHWCDRHGTRELLEQLQRSLPPL